MCAWGRRGRNVPQIHKVLMVVENEAAPADGRVWSEAEALRDRGLRVTIISPKGPTKHREPYVCLDGIHIYRYNLPSGKTSAAYIAEYGIALFKTYVLSLKVFIRHGFDVIHVANPPDIFFLLGLFYRPLGVKFVFDQHDLAPELFKVLFKDHGNHIVRRLLGNVLLLFERWSYRTASLVIVTNASFGRIAIQRGRCPVDKVSIVRNGPDHQKMKPAPPEPELKMGRRHLLAYVGVMSPQDGVEYALYALHSLVYTRGRKDVSLVLMGDGVSTPTLHALAHDLQLDDYVMFTGWTQPEDIVRYLSAADIGLSPDPANELNDSCTMIKTMEYMAMGKPVVAFDLTETRFSAQEAGLYATPNVVEDFASKIEVLLDNEDMRRTMGMAARKRVEEALCWERSKEQLLLAYATLLHEHSDQPKAGVGTRGMASALRTESGVAE